MKPQFSDLWRWPGTIDRGPYAWWGFGLTALKYNLDRLVAGIAFDREWRFWSYFTAPTGPLPALGSADAAFYGTLTLLALPFVWAGVVLTAKRLRSVGLPTSLVGLFFVPVVNLLFFGLLCLLPPREAGPGATRRHERLARWIPRSKLGSAAVGLVLTAVCGLALTLVSVEGLNDYGAGLFVGVPFLLGFWSVVIYGYHQPRGLLSCLGVGLGSVALLGLLLFALLVEGLICLVMAAPLGLVLGMMGAVLGYFVQRAANWGRQRLWAGAVMILLLPLLMGAEVHSRGEAPLIAVRTVVTIQAPPEVVWRHVVSFSELPAPTHWLFRTGIAYPVRATVDGTGVGAIRRCEFSTGPFVEPITHWEPPRLLGFSVAEQPRPMRELSLHPDLDAPHLDHFLVCQRGEFRLTAVAGGTRLEGTTWYRHRIWPAAYWRLFSDAVIHGIHARVLEHIKHLAEH